MAKKESNYYEWDGFMTKQEQDNMVDFIMYLYEGYEKWCKAPLKKDKDRYIYHVLYLAVRDVTRIIGESKNLKISEKARKLLKVDETTTYRGLLNSIRANPRQTVKEHYKPADDHFFEQFRECCNNGKPFTREQARKWLNDAVIAIITKNEDEALTKKGFGKKRPDPAEAYTSAGIEVKHFTPAKR